MRRLLAIVLSTAAFGAAFAATPAVAQVAGNPGHIHTGTLYMTESNQYPSRFAVGPTAGFPTFLTPGPAQGCGVNGQYASVCSL
jgi:hypothetical protein